METVFGILGAVAALVAGVGGGAALLRWVRGPIEIPFERENWPPPVAQKIEGAEDAKMVINYEIEDYRANGYVQALVSKGSVERFDEAIVRWLTGSAEVDPHSMMIRPEIEHAPRKFAPIVRKDTLRSAALCNQRVTHLDNVLAS